MRRVRVTTVAMEKQYLLHIIRVFVALVTLDAQRMRRIILLSVSSLATPYISTNVINVTIVGKTLIEHKMCVLIFSTVFF